jgi:putative ABC transport system substrate-binding protein
MRRRNFIKAAAASASSIVWPFAARAQQPAMPVIGFLGAASAKTYEARLRPFLEALKGAGFIEGQSVRVEYRWSGDQYDKLPALAAELASIPVTVMIAAGGAPAANAAKSATATIPIVFQTGSDPVRMKWVASLAHPGGNMTGVTNVSVETVTKRLELMRELVPPAGVLGYMTNPRNPNTPNVIKEVASAARTLGREIVVVNSASLGDLDHAFATLVQRQVGALVLTSDPIAAHWRDELIERAARHAIPTMYPNRDFVQAGGLVSYGATYRDVYREVGVYAARILKGERPSELPVVQSTKYELVLNNNTAKALGLEVPLSVLMRIDAVVD